MTSIFTELTPGEIDLLLSIPQADGNPPNGVSVIAEYKTRRDGRGSEGTLRGYLKRLVNDEFVIETEINGKERGYRLTAKGRAMLRLLRDDIDRALEGNE